jgi:uncharacterized protein
MITDPLQLRQMAEAKERENFRFRDFLKHRTGLSSEEVDKLVIEISERVWRTIDCTTCGNCCRQLVPTLSAEEGQQLAQHLGLGNAEFTSRFLQPGESGEENPWAFRACPCPFLEEKRCTVYDFRPADCRDYPYLDSPDFAARTLSMLGRLSVCPAVFEVWEQLKRATGFRHRPTSRWHPPI